MVRVPSGDMIGSGLEDKWGSSMLLNGNSGCWFPFFIISFARELIGTVNGEGLLRMHTSMRRTRHRTRMRGPVKGGGECLQCVVHLRYRLCEESHPGLSSHSIPVGLGPRQSPRSTQRLQSLPPRVLRSMEAHSFSALTGADRDITIL